MTCARGFFLLSLLPVAMVLGWPVHLLAFRIKVEDREMIEGRRDTLALSDVFTAVQPKTPSFTMNSYTSPSIVCIFSMLKQSESGSGSTNLVQTCQCDSLSYNWGAELTYFSWVLVICVYSLVTVEIRSFSNVQIGHNLKWWCTWLLSLTRWWKFQAMIFEVKLPKDKSVVSMTWNLVPYMSLHCHVMLHALVAP